MAYPSASDLSEGDADVCVRGPARRATSPR